MRHPRPNPNQCPYCNAEGALRELGKRYTWQPVRFVYDDDGSLIGDEYEEFDYGDDVEVTGFECGECYSTWETAGALAHEQRVAQALRDHAEHWRTRGERLRELDDAGRMVEDIGDRIGYADGRATAFEYALAILQGNGEA